MRRIRTCRLCSSQFHLEAAEKGNNRCPECREKARHKKCRACGGEYKDDSDKNTRRFCDPCVRVIRAKKTGVSPRLSERRKHRLKKGDGGRMDDLSSLTPFTTTWWGRVGEALFQHLYPQALDAVELYGNGAAFDFECRSLGRVNVKTAKESETPHGLPSWKFQIEGVNKECDHAFFIGFDKGQTFVRKAWLMLAPSLPDRLKVMTPESLEYRGGAQEVSAGEVTTMSRKLKGLLESASSKLNSPKPKAPAKPEYERVVLGRIGEAVYASLFPESDQVSKRNPVETFDFLNAAGTKVNVRVRRPYLDGRRERWTFFQTAGCTASEYFFLGLDPSGGTVEIALRIPTVDLPLKGFSLGRHMLGGNSKWLRYSLDLGLPKRISEFIGVEDFERTHIEVTSFNASARGEMSPTQLELLLQQSLLYHRTLGFPYPSIPSDKRLLSELEEIYRYEAEEKTKTLPRSNAGLGFCSAYMPHRFESKNSEADFSAYEAFEDNQRLLRALKFAASGKSPSLRRRALRSSLTVLNRTPVNFRPAVAAALCRRYAGPGQHVFDPCAGWGGRLVGALSAKCLYTGVEPSEKTCESLYRIGSRLSMILGADRAGVRILKGKIQEVPLEKGWADFSLTSPPYWVKEEYPGVVADSGSFEDWVVSFLYPLFERVHWALKDTGKFAIAVSDIEVGGKEYPLVEVTREVAGKVGYKLIEVWKMHKHSFGNSKRMYEEVMVFGKNPFSETYENLGADAS